MLNGTKAILSKNIVIIALVFVFIAVDARVHAFASQDNWVKLDTPHFVIHATREAHLDQVGKMAEAIYTEMAARYNYNQEQKINLYIYNNRSAFLKQSPSVEAVGYASPSQNLIAIFYIAKNLNVTLKHEINHIIFLRSIARINTVPEWFVEGLAIHESQPGVEAAEIEKYMLARDIPEFVNSSSSLKSDPATRQDYAQGHIMIGFIIKRFGKEKLYEIIKRLQSGEDFNSSLISSLGESERELNAEWRSYARNRVLMIWIQQLRDVGWYLMSILVILTVIIAPIRKRKRLREMEDEEEEDLPTASS